MSHTKEEVAALDSRLHDTDAIASAPSSRASNTLVYPANKRQEAIFGDQRVVTCASCRHYRHKSGQQEIADQNFGDALREYGWKLSHLCADIRTMAICGQHDDMLVGPFTKACEHYADTTRAVVVPMRRVKK